ncbi:MAG: non-homologous end-joining DNA ligase [Polyangia bacterium]|jgi:bifunctional non-homologous end joining protein LigD
MALEEYRRKRNFGLTPEPPARLAAGPGHSFVVQKHAARQLHYDFRLELDGVLKSWAVPKGPCLDPSARRLAVAVEDHPLAYGTFEGIIPAGQYGAGTVLLWDRGTWHPLGDPSQGLAAGHLKFELHGEKLQGRWALVRMKTPHTKPRAGSSHDGDGDGGPNWLLIKDRDEHARSESEWNVTLARPDGVASGRDLPAIAAGTPAKASTPAKAGTPAKADTPAKTGTSALGQGTGQVRVAGVRLTHPERMLYPAVGVTKLDLARFYERVGERMLPYLMDRPLTLLRGPQGMTGQRFYARHTGAATPREIRHLDISRGTGSGTAMMVDDLPGLIALAQMNVLEIHPWNARAQDLDHPDRMVFDLDPGPEVAWLEVVAAARDVRQVLETLGLVSFVKTTGGKGLHVVVPLDRGPSWEDTLEFSRLVAQGLALFAPARFSAGLAKARRADKTFVDYLRNRRAATAVSAYSARASDKATVSVPLTWEGLGKSPGPAAFRLDEVLDWYPADDPWDGYAQTVQQLTSAQIKAARQALASADRGPRRKS